MLLRTYIRALIAEEMRDRMMGGPVSFQAPQRADFNDANVVLGDDHLDDEETVNDKFGPVPPKTENPKIYQDPCARDYLRWSGVSSVSNR